MENLGNSLQKIKAKLKSFEREFLANHKRKPTKGDIQDSSSEIISLYKEYQTLKCEASKPIKTGLNSSDVWGSHLNKCNEQKKDSLEYKNVTNVSANAVYARKLRENAQTLRQKEVRAAEEIKKKKFEEQQKFENVFKDDTLFKSKFKICSNRSEISNCKSVNLFRMEELKFPVDEIRYTSSFDVSQDSPPPLFEPETEPELEFQAPKSAAKEEQNSGINDSSVQLELKSHSAENEMINAISNVELNLTTCKIKQQDEVESKPIKISVKKRKVESSEVSSPIKISVKKRKVESSQVSSFDKRPKKTAQSENYVRINLKKRVYCRGKKKVNYKKYKFNKWKEIQRTKKPFKVVKNVKNCVQNDDSEDSSFETYLEEAVSRKEIISLESTNGESGTTSGESNSRADSYSTVQPIYSNLTSEEEDEIELTSYLRKFGHETFRPGQLQAIRRVLAGVPALIIQPTGSGKSLCYLLPALIYAQRSSCITLVISPLVSLMEDQLSNVPSCINAACLHTNMTERQREKIRKEISAGDINLLFISPESLVGGAGSAFGCLPPSMPPIAFVCIDEVHCVSTWSHNFRPSYLRLCHVVRDVLGVKCILGLTATATTCTINDVCKHIGMENEAERVIKATQVPDNLQLTVSIDHSEQSLLELLQNEPFVGCNSIIIYCIQRQTTERLATLIRTYFQEKKIKSEMEWSAESYHAGLSAARRRTIQKQFMQSQLRVIVATVAFGMGVNKADVRAVIHYDLPKSVESYVQEIGRAGRDFEPAFCHLFLDLKGEDRRELRRHIYSDTVDRVTIRRLCELVFATSLERTEEVDDAGSDGGSEEAFSVEKTVALLDLKQEGIQTLLSYLELHPESPIQIMNCTYGRCKLYCYSDTTSLKDLAKICPAVDVALKMKGKNERVTADRRVQQSNMLNFPLIQVARILNCGVQSLRKELKKLQWEEIPISEGGVRYQKTGVVVEFNDLCFHLKTTKSYTNTDVDRFIDYLHSRVVSKEKAELQQLHFLYRMLHGFSFSKFWHLEREKEARYKSEGLKSAIDAFFRGESIAEEEIVDEDLKPSEEEHLRSDVRQLLSVHHEYKFTGRAVARIFHGIPSPNYPVETWGRVRQFWRRHLAFDFNRICQLATEEIIGTKRCSSAKLNEMVFPTWN